MRGLIGVVISAGVVLGLLGCGSSSHSSTANSTSSTALTISAYVVRGGEETGFHPGRPEIDRTVAAADAGDPNAQATEQRLTSEGFVQGARVNTSGADGGQGGSSVTELGSPAAAARELQASVKQVALAQGGAAVSRFVVAGIPGSVGVLAAAPAGGQSTANLYFNEGRCNLWVGDETSKPDYRAAVTAAALAIYARTNGKKGPCTA